jgi:hypothetical protein
MTSRISPPFIQTLRVKVIIAFPPSTINDPSTFFTFNEIIAESGFISFLKDQMESGI